MDYQTAIVALFALYILYLFFNLVFKAYFAARREHIYHLVEKAKEITRGKE